MTRVRVRLPAGEQRPMDFPTEEAAVDWLDGAGFHYSGRDTRAELGLDDETEVEVWTRGDGRTVCLDLPSEPDTRSQR